MLGRLLLASVSVYLRCVFAYVNAFYCKTFRNIPLNQMSTYFTMINIKNRNDCNSNHDGWCTFPLNFLCNALTRLAYSPAIMLDLKYVKLKDWTPRTFLYRQCIFYIRMSIKKYVLTYQMSLYLK
jgi:hypothetical protein